MSLKLNLTQKGSMSQNRLNQETHLTTDVLFTVCKDPRLLPECARGACPALPH